MGGKPRYVDEDELTNEELYARDAKIDFYEAVLVDCRLRNDDEQEYAYDARRWLWIMYAERGRVTDQVLERELAGLPTLPREDRAALHLALGAEFLAGGGPLLRQDLERAMFHLDRARRAGIKRIPEYVEEVHRALREFGDLDALRRFEQFFKLEPILGS